MYQQGFAETLNAKSTLGVAIIYQDLKEKKLLDVIFIGDDFSLCLQSFWNKLVP